MTVGHCTFSSLLLHRAMWALVATPNAGVLLFRKARRPRDARGASLFRHTAVCTLVGVSEPTTLCGCKEQPVPVHVQAITVSIKFCDAQGLERRLIGCSHVIVAIAVVIVPKAS